MPWIWAALMPHPPVMIAQVGQGRERAAALTLEGVRKLQDSLRKPPGGGAPKGLMILSPHQPYVRGGLYLNSADVLSGDLRRFGAPQIAFRLERHQAWESVYSHLRSAGLDTGVAPAPDLGPDHGSLVPLHFLAQVFDIPEVVIANPVGMSLKEAWQLGKALAGFGHDEPWALLASGDLSHRLTQEAPAGYDPEGRLFDHDLVAALEDGTVDNLLTAWPSERLSRAGECGCRSALALLGLAGGPVEVFSYEGPFGVGYANALWVNDCYAR